MRSHFAHEIPFIQHRRQLLGLSVVLVVLAVVGLVALLIVLCILLATVVLKGSANQDKPTDGSAVRGPASSSASPFSAPPAKK